ncbi:hypothetical protein [Paenibacillus sp. GYB003]|uniref:hypothetical protein n=1 Tax=Paenibacillus sp. GYB003 TaxID=2994392 RepID=UPI002F96A242
MKVVFKLIAYMIVVVTIFKVNTEDRMIMLGEVRSYGAVILAAHDAAVLNKSREAEGYIVFDEPVGTIRFRESLIHNLGLNPDMTPKNTAVFSGEIKVVGLYFVGDDKVPHDPMGRPIYPYSFVQNTTYRGSPITVREQLFGPSVVALIEVPLNTESKPVQIKTAVYRYLDKRL